MDSPFLLDVRPIDLGLVDGLVLVLVLLMLCSIFIVWILFHFLLVGPATRHSVVSGTLVVNVSSV